MDAYHRQMLDLVRAALAEDIGPGDVTSMACLEPERAKAQIVAKSDGIVSGLDLVVLTFQMVDTANKVSLAKKDGYRFAAGDTIVTIEGFNQTILTAERTALNFLAHLSGIASLTGKFVEQIKSAKCKVLDTRKTTPGYRHLEKQAVVHGGGTNHRIGLYDMVLIKDNHIVAAGGVNEAIRLAIDYLNTPESRRQFGKWPDDIEIEVEVTTVQQLTDAINAGATRLLLDNQSLESLTKLVATAHAINPEVKLEASGNVTLDTVGEIATTGVDFISAGAITHSAPASDFSLRLTDKP
ncbi:MAG: carboxylating nicotinate-nucleotide diphosphorylase [candidate division Zixibacteria bacterium]|nr:carboxylating nicotinate-nucleotide diphosphorylase [candidate division Zixibacteria bacterium]